ncbi:MAG: RsmE family RNA methyltransferase [Bacilli bacterium]
MQRYFAKELVDDTFTLSKEDTYHIVTVMRLNINDLVEVVYKEEMYISKIISLCNLIKVQIVNKVVNNYSKRPNITICQSLVKEAKMDLILQKATELGVSSIIPIKTTRGLVKLDAKEDKKIKRWQTIVKEASEQSKRLDIPIITKTKSLKEIIKGDYTYKILLSVNETSINVKKVLSKVLSNDTIIIVIGPEGGFTNEEEELLIKGDFISTSLGDLVLRTETASISILSMINYIMME